MAGLQGDDAILAGLGESEHNRVLADKQPHSAEPKLERSRSSSYEVEEQELPVDYPTEEEKMTLRRVPDSVNMAAYLIAFVGQPEIRSPRLLRRLLTSFSNSQSSLRGSATMVRLSCSVSRLSKRHFGARRSDPSRRNASGIHADRLTTANFIQRGLPEGSTTGAVSDAQNQRPGALGLGQQASTGRVRRERSRSELD